MYEYLPDALIVVGFGLIVTGVTLIWGFEMALIISGVMLLAAGAGAVWRQSR